MKRAGVSLVIASNNQETLAKDILRSPDLRNIDDLDIMLGFESAGAAYCAALEEARNELVIFAHQDVYLPAGWLELLHQWIARLQQVDDRWAAAGLYGISCENRRPVGYLY